MTSDSDRIAVDFGTVWLHPRVLDRDGNRGGAFQNGKNNLQEQKQKHLSPDLMNDLSPEARPVDVALPPRATVIAESAALFPPGQELVSKKFK